MLHRASRPSLFPIVFLTALLIEVCAIGFAQEVARTKISGRVIDDSTRAPVVNANVFIANSMIGTSSNTSGYFVLRNVPSGSHELVVSCIGYFMSTSRIQVLAGNDQEVEIRLRPKMIGFGTVEILARRDEKWKESLDTFKKLLLGSTLEAKDCQIANPEVLEFSTDQWSRLQAKADKELTIDNHALGYRLHLSLGTLRLGDRWLTSMYKSRFEELQPSNTDQRADWDGRRITAYSGSLRHFLAALAKGNLSKEGFAAYASQTRTMSSTVRLYEFNENEIVRQAGPTEWLLRFDAFLVIDYDRVRVNAGFDNSLWKGPIPSIRSKRSILSLEKDSVLFDSRGQILTQFALRISGDWAAEGLAKDLPIEFGAPHKK